MPTKLWKKGESGNPNGRPKVGNTWAELIRKVGEETSPVEKKKKKLMVVDAMFRKAMAGDVQAAKLLTEMEIGRQNLTADLNVRFAWIGENGPEDSNGPV